MASPAVSRQGSGTPWLIAGGLLYLGGVMVVTGICHVPRNNALAAVDPSAETAQAAWTRYYRGWTMWNHVRAAAGLAAAAALMIGLI
jgi:uncharacterized membrane protein